MASAHRDVETLADALKPTVAPDRRCIGHHCDADAPLDRGQASRIVESVAELVPALV